MKIYCRGGGVRRWRAISLNDHCDERLSAGENATTQTRMHFRVENRKHKNNRRKRRKIYINKVRPVAGSIAALRGFDDIVHFKRLLWYRNNENGFRNILFRWSHVSSISRNILRCLSCACVRELPDAWFCVFCQWQHRLRRKSSWMTRNKFALHNRVIRSETVEGCTLCVLWQRALFLKEEILCQFARGNFREFNNDNATEESEKEGQGSCSGSSWPKCRYYWTWRCHGDWRRSVDNVRRWGRCVTISICVPSPG